MSEVLCFKRMNHILCHLDGGRRGGAMLETKRQFSSLFFVVVVFFFFFSLENSVLIWIKYLLVFLFDFMICRYNENTGQHSSPNSTARHSQPR